MRNRIKVTVQGYGFKKTKQRRRKDGGTRSGIDANCLYVISGCTFSISKRCRSGGAQAILKILIQDSGGIFVQRWMSGTNR